MGYALVLFAQPNFHSLKLALGTVPPFLVDFLINQMQTPHYQPTASARAIGYSWNIPECY
jgi:hypothetical protein